MPNDLPRPSRRTALRAAALAAGTVTFLAGCDDSPESGAPSAGRSGGSGTPSASTPSTDPAVVAALTTAATQIQQLAQRHAGATRSFPALRTRLAPAVRNHAAQLARLKQAAGFTTLQPGKLPPLPSSSAAALADLAAREQKLSVQHATAATRLTGEPARLLAMIAAAESQLAVTLDRSGAAS